ncbi:MAG: major tail protein [Christensenellales bacterium]|jgi:phi13 family phage major tail protein
MAKIGLRTSIFAPITSEPINSMPVYGEAVHGHERLTSMSLSWTRNDEKLYADDVVAEADNSVTGAELEMGVDDLSESFEVAALGVVKDPTGGYLEDTDDVGTPGGYGFVQVSVYKGVRKYIANWFYKVLFGKSDEEGSTKGEKIEYGTPKITGTAMGVMIDESGKAKFRRRKEFTTYAEALAFLKDIAGIV